MKKKTLGQRLIILNGLRTNLLTTKLTESAEETAVLSGSMTQKKTSVIAAIYQSTLDCDLNGILRLKIMQCQKMMILAEKTTNNKNKKTARIRAKP